MGLSSEPTSEGQADKGELVQENGKVYYKTTDANGITHYKQLGLVEKTQAQTAESYRRSKEEALLRVKQGADRVKAVVWDLLSGLPRQRQVGESLKSDWSPEQGSISVTRGDGLLARIKKNLQKRAAKLGKQSTTILEDVEGIKSMEEHYRQIQED